jgi:hypothetical protein
MKNNVLKYYIAAFYLCSTFVLFAQPGDGNGESGDAGLEGGGDTTPGAPIDGYVWILAAIGLVYFFLRLRAFTLQEKGSEK